MLSKNCELIIHDDYCGPNDTLIGIIEVFANGREEGSEAIIFAKPMVIDSHLDSLTVLDVDNHEVVPHKQIGSHLFQISMPKGRLSVLAHFTESYMAPPTTSFLMSDNGHLVVREDFTEDLYFRVTDGEIPLGYTIWNLGRNIPDGYLPLCRPRPNEPDFEDVDSLVCVPIAGSQVILDAVGVGYKTVCDMCHFIKKMARRKNLSPSEKEDLARCEAAIPLLAKVRCPSDCGDCGKKDSCACVWR